MDIEFQSSGGLFHRLGVSALPYVFRLAPMLAIEGDGAIKIRQDDVMKHADYAKFPWEAEDFASFVQEKVRPACIAVGPAVRPRSTAAGAFNGCVQHAECAAQLLTTQPKLAKVVLIQPEGSVPPWWLSSTAS